MRKRTATTANLQKQSILQRGFSILEMMIVTIVIFIVVAEAVLQLEPAWQQIQANSALNQVKTTLRQARELSISQRRTIIVAFPAAGSGACHNSGNVSNCITLTLMNVTAGSPPTQTAATTPFLTAPLEGNVKFLTYTGEPDTPDAFIGTPPTAPNGIYTGSAAGAPTSGMQFESDGTFDNGSGVPINLTIFLGETNLPTTARAITILGNTGRVTWYQGTGKAWFRV